MAWDPITTPIDFWKLQGQKSPGIGRVQKAGSPRKWDERGGPGAGGAVLAFWGRGLAKFDGIIELYTPEDWVAWRKFKPLVDRPPFGAQPKALDIWHPYLADLGISSCVVLNVSQPEDLELGGQRITIEFQEFRALKLELAKPEASKKSADPDPYEKEIAKLTDQFGAELAKHR
jgi:hypothetical protein